MHDNAALLADLIGALATGRIRVVDLSVSLGPDTPLLKLPDEFAQTPPIEIHEISNFDDKGPWWYWNWLKVGEHSGTHFDAPIHWITGKDYNDGATDTIPPHKFIGPACVIDVERDAEKNPDFCLSVEHIEKWEKAHGKIPPRAWVILRSGWSRQPSNDAFLNIDAESGPHTPGPTPEAVHFLSDQRDVLGYGTETVGTDAGQAASFDPPFPCHSHMHGNNRFGLASLTNVDQLPPTGAVIVAAPLKIVKGSGSPCRALALVPS